MPTMPRTSKKYQEIAEDVLNLNARISDKKKKKDRDANKKTKNKKRKEEGSCE